MAKFWLIVVTHDVVQPPLLPAQASSSLKTFETSRVEFSLLRLVGRFSELNFLAIDWHMMKATESTLLSFETRTRRQIDGLLERSREHLKNNRMRFAACCTAKPIFIPDDCRMFRKANFFTTTSHIADL